MGWTWTFIFIVMSIIDLREWRTVELQNSSRTAALVGNMTLSDSQGCQILCQESHRPSREVCRLQWQFRCSLTEKPSEVYPHREWDKAHKDSHPGSVERPVSVYQETITHERRDFLNTCTSLHFLYHLHMHHYQCHWGVECWKLDQTFEYIFDQKHKKSNHPHFFNVICFSVQDSAIIIHHNF